MCAVQGSFPQLKDRFLYSEDITDHNIFLHLITMLLNFRTHYVGLNHLKSTFYPAFEEGGDKVLQLFSRKGGYIYQFPNIIIIIDK